MESLRLQLDELKQGEAELANAKWRSWDDDNSPRGVADGDLVKRYKQARDLYLQRRLENVLVEHISTYNGSENFAEAFEFPDVPDQDEEELQQRHKDALANLESLVQTIHSQVDQLKNTQEIVNSRRQELEQMMQEMDTNTEAGDAATADEENMEEGEEDPEEAMALEQERIEQLQQTKRKLQEQLKQMERETEESKENTRQTQQQIQQIKAQRLEKSQQGVIPQDITFEELNQKVEELKEMKAFYDSLRGVLEELGGVKIQKIREDTINQHLYLNLLFYNEFSVEVELQVYRKVFLKLVNAKWLGKPIVRPAAPFNAPKDLSTDENFSLTLDSLDDLVQVAKTTLGPPHDLRFLVRETLARIRINQNRVQDLAELRTRVLTKVHNGNQVVCSLNDGVIVVMRLYERFVRVEQIVGVSGWNEAATQRIHDAIPTDVDVHNPMKPTEVLQHVCDEIERLKSDGLQPRTPRFPMRKGGFS